jgi:GTP pyrophosphokinase
MSWSDFQPHIRHFTAIDQESIQKAYMVGEKAHEGQKRRSGEPYFTHPIAVARILIDMGADADTVAAALLHDTVEDTPLTLQEIEREFNPDIAMLIDGVTKLSESELENQPTLDEQIETLRKMFTLMQKDIRIMVIKLADRLHNMQTIVFKSQESQIASAKETIDVYVKIADRLCMRDIRNDLQALCISVLDKERYKRLLDVREKNETIAHHVIGAFQETFKKEQIPFPVTLKYETKSFDALQVQLDLEGDEPSGAFGVAVACICEDVDHCYRTLGVLHTLWEREAMTFEDHINSPIINGYKGIHTTIIMENGTRVRCKIRTREMDEYAHRGITVFCFTSQPDRIREYLPWTQNISALSKDTERHSQDFWQSLQRDILGESIIIYGPANQTAVIPKNATALDGVLYLFHGKGLQTSEIRVNGKHVPFNHTLDHATTLDVTFSPKKTVQREWLRWAHTGIAIAEIRTALSTSPAEMMEVGRALLQEELHNMGKGYVEEFNRESLRENLQNIGFASMDEAYMAIANGHVETSSVARAFTKQSKIGNSNATDKKRYVIRFSLDRNVENLRRLTNVYERFGIDMESLRLSQKKSETIDASLAMSLTPEDQEGLRQELIAIGAQKVSVVARMPLETTLMGVVILFWALNPVIAKHFLMTGIAPITLVTLRSIVFFSLTTTFFLIWKFLNGSRFAPVQGAFRLALLPAIGTFALSFITYMSVGVLPPSVHLTILRFNVLLLPLFHLFFRKNLQRRTAISAVILFAASIGLLLTPTTHLPAIGIVYAVLALVAYVYYSLVTERTLQNNKIGARYPYFLFYLGLIVGLLGLLLLPSQLAISSVWEPRLLPIILYVAFCVFVPHTCFQIVLQRVRFTRVTSMSLLEVPLAMVFEILLLGIWLPWFLYLLIGCILLSFVLLLRRERVGQFAGLMGS